MFEFSGLTLVFVIIVLIIASLRILLARVRHRGSGRTLARRMSMFEFSGLTLVFVIIVLIIKHAHSPCQGSTSRIRSNPGKENEHV